MDMKFAQVSGFPQVGENMENREKVKKNSLQGKIREFEKKIREKSGNLPWTGKKS